MQTKDPVTAARSAFTWFVAIGTVAGLILAVFATLALAGQLPAGPANIPFVSIPLFAAMVTFVGWRQAQQRVDARADTHAELVPVLAELADMRVQLTELLLGIGRRAAEDTLPLPRAVGTAYLGRAHEMIARAREEGIAVGYDLGVDAAPRTDATILRIDNHRR